MSCSPEFIQAGGLAAITDGEDFIKTQMTRYRKMRDLSVTRLNAIDGIECIPPRAAFYVFFRIDGVKDCFAFSEELVRETQVGIAPGIAFDPTMTDWFRICFAKDETILNTAFDRLEAFLEARR